MKCLLTLAEIAVLAHAHPSTVWRHRRELGARKLFGRWKVPAAAWERYQRRGQIEVVKTAPCVCGHEHTISKQFCWPKDGSDCACSWSRPTDDFEIARRQAMRGRT